VLLTEWNQYRALDFKKVLCLMQKPVFIDLGNVYEPHRLRELGFVYFGNGRG